ncbi:hypothetical protein [Pseudomonas sp. fls2-241-R2A-110]|uniref:hypothetical protein n=1 Tax=Pseudomonas sp. fls2-241-R2A-110 TaxID=3040311 RepID=UPI0025552567|nr:hypothetical protein [Pseudomonas sp. fls2-241-R2A-110]
MTSISTDLESVTSPTPTTARQYFNTTLQSFLSEDTRKTYYAISLLSGLMIFFIYFSHINYTPKISITDSVMLIFSALVIGVGFSLILAGLFILPALIWKEMLGDSITGERKQRFKYLAIRQGVLPLALLILALCMTLYPKHFQWFAMGLAFSVLLWFFSLIGDEKIGRHILAFICNGFVLSICTFMLINIAMHGVEDIKNAEEREMMTRFYLFSALTMTVLYNLFVASFEDFGLKEASVGAGLLLASIFLSTQSIATIPKGVMHILGQGSFRANEIILNGEICDYFKSKNPSKTEQLSTQTCSLKEPWILWKGDDVIMIKIQRTKYPIDRKDIKIFSYDVFPNE